MGDLAQIQFRSLIVALVLLVASSIAQGTEESESLAVYVENDSTNIGGPGSDEAYSNGVKFSYIYAQDKLPFWGPIYRDVHEFLNFGDSPVAVNYGLSLGHQIYTPIDIEDTGLILDDRPYAAWLYANLSTSIKYKDWLHIWSLGVGIVGPSAQGEFIQKEFHSLIDSPQPRGWKHQLHDELGVKLTYQRRDRLFEFRKKALSYFDVISLLGGSIGNVRIDLSTGLLFRLGYGLKNDFGPSRPSGVDADGLVSPVEHVQKKYRLYSFIGLKESAIARDIFLDGNTFRKSHRVDREPFVGEVDFGVSAQIHSVSLVWSRIWRGPEFKEGDKSHSFASISLGYIGDF